MRQAQFFTLLAQTGVVGYSARGVGMSRASASKLRGRPGAGSFAAAWDAAIDIGRARAFDLAMVRAVTGVTTDRYHHGKIVGTRHRFDTAGHHRTDAAPRSAAARRVSNARRCPKHRQFTGAT